LRAGTPESTEVFSHTSLDDYADRICAPLVLYVARVREPIVLENAAASGQYSLFLSLFFFSFPLSQF
jgi:hypothetical protein